MVFQEADPRSLEKLFTAPANIAIIGSGKSEVFERIKSSYDLSLYCAKVDDRQGLLDAIHSGKKGILTTSYGSSPTQLMFLLAIWLREKGDRSNEKVLLEKATQGLDFIIGTKKYPRDHQARITQVWHAPFAA